MGWVGVGGGSVRAGGVLSPGCVGNEVEGQTFFELSLALVLGCFKLSLSFILRCFKLSLSFILGCFKLSFGFILGCFKLSLSFILRCFKLSLSFILGCFKLPFVPILSNLIISISLVLVYLKLPLILILSDFELSVTLVLGHLLQELLCGLRGLGLEDVLFFVVEGRIQLFGGGLVGLGADVGRLVQDGLVGLQGLAAVAGNAGHVEALVGRDQLGTLDLDALVELVGQKIDVLLE